MIKRKIAYISGTRADFGLLEKTLRLIRSNPAFQLQVYATGMQIMKLYGNSIREVREAFPDSKIIPSVFKSDSSQSQLLFISDLITRLTHEFTIERPDVVMVLGDRIEMLGVAIVSTYLHIPIVHIHGGDVTGIVDEPVRHAITKLAHIHCTATKKSGECILKMGEDAWRIHVVGAPGLDDIYDRDVLSKKETYDFLHLSDGQKYILITLHPDDKEYEKNVQNMKIVIEAVRSFSLPMVILYPNSDPGGRAIISLYKKMRKIVLLYPHIPRRQFLGVAKFSSVWIGNSSAQNIESCSLHVPTVSIGQRELGREHGKNMIYVPYTTEKIKQAIRRSISDSSYIARVKQMKNPWGNGKTAERIVQIIQSATIDNRLLNKRLSY